MARRERTGVMLAYPFDVRRLNKWPKPWFVQPKINGERCRVVIANREVRLFSSSALEITSVPHLVDSFNSICGHTLTLDGELYHHGWKQQRTHRIVSRTVNLHPDHEQIQFYCFDLIEDSPQHERFRKLKAFFQRYQLPFVYQVPTVECRTKMRLLQDFDYWTDEGYEGVIIRHPNQTYITRKTPFMMKMKKSQDAVFRVVGYEEERDKDGNLKGSLGAIVVKLPTGGVSSVGTGFTYDERVDLWLDRDSLIGRKARVRYQEFSEKDNLLMSSFKGFVD